VKQPETLAGDPNRPDDLAALLTLLDPETIGNFVWQKYVLGLDGPPPANDNVITGYPPGAGWVGPGGKFGGGPIRGGPIRSGPKPGPIVVGPNYPKGSVITIDVFPPGPQRPVPISRPVRPLKPPGLKNPQWHHDLPKKFRDIFKDEFGLDFNDPSHGRWSKARLLAGIRIGAISSTSNGKHFLKRVLPYIRF
jgi:hypothetical protein